MLFDESLSKEDRIEALIASTSLPLVFPPEDIEQWSLTDGSVFSTVSLGDLIERCREEGVASDEDIIIDMLLCYEDVYDMPEINRSKAGWMNALDFYNRRKAISLKQFYLDDVLRVLKGFSKVTLRHIVKPSVALEAPLVPTAAS